MAETLVRHRFSVVAYHRMGETGILAADARVELIDGEVVELAPIGSRHFACGIRLARMLQRAAGDEAIVSVQGPVTLDEHAEPQPDLALLVARADFYVERLPSPRDVLLVIEVADTTLNYDRDVKAPLYARAGIPACWVIDLNAREILVFSRPRADGYRDHRRAILTDTIDIDGLPGRTAPVEQLIGPGSAQ